MSVLHQEISPPDDFLTATEFGTMGYETMEREEILNFAEIQVVKFVLFISNHFVSASEPAKAHEGGATSLRRVMYTSHRVKEEMRLVSHKLPCCVVVQDPSRFVASDKKQKSKSRLFDHAIAVRYPNNYLRSTRLQGRHFHFSVSLDRA